MAIGPQTASDFGGAVSDLFAAEGMGAKAQGDEFEKQNYLAAADLADQNEKFAETSTNIKQMQADRELYTSLGQTTAAVAGAGLQTSGSALDILHQSASEGAMTRAVLGEQGLISEAGYREQEQSYRNLASAAQVAEDAAKSAGTGLDIAAGIKAIAGIATFATGGAAAPIAGAVSLGADDLSTLSATDPGDI